MSLGLELRQTLRSLLYRRWYTLVAVSSVAVGVGATTGVYSWLDNFVLRPLPTIPQINQIAALNLAAGDGSVGGSPGLDYPMFQEWQRQTQGLLDMAASAPTRLAVRTGVMDFASPAWGLLVSANYFRVLRVPAALGRTLGPDDEAGQAPVAVVSDFCWRHTLGGDPGIVGKEIWLNGMAVTVVGVMPPDFTGHDVGYAFDFWLPITLQPAVSPGANLLTDSKTRWLSGVARLPAGASFADLNRRLALIARRASEVRGDRPVVSGALIPLREWRAGSVLTPILSSLLVVTSLVALLASANLASLSLLQRVAGRRETGIRLALGAEGGDLARLFFLESALVTGVGGVIGLLLSRTLAGLLPWLIPPTPQPIRFVSTFTWRIGAVGLGVAGVVLVLAGLIPALRASRQAPADVIRTGSVPVFSGRRLGNLGLVLVQVALTATNLVMAMFFLRSLEAGRKADVGFDRPAQVLLLGVDLATAVIAPERQAAMIDQLLQRLGSLPGVRSAGGATMVPLGAGGHRFAPTEVEGYQPGPSEDMGLELSQVTDGYFQTMGIEIVRGRPFTEQDRVGTVPVAIVNQAFARRYWPGQEPQGRRVDQGRGWASVVGVARDGHYDNLADPPEPLVFWPLRQWPRSSFTIHLRATNADPRLLIPAAREAAA